MERLIKYERSIIPALDMVDLRELVDLVEKTHEVDGIGAYKLGCVPALTHGIPTVMGVVRDITDIPVIYDHQKAGTDIPDMGKKFMPAVLSHLDAVILFPMSGPATHKAWIKEARRLNGTVIVGGLMTHEAFHGGEGGYLQSDVHVRIYGDALIHGIVDFVVPGTKPEETGGIVKAIREALSGKSEQPSFYFPGIGAQGGDMGEIVRLTGGRCHAIVGRALYNAPDPAAVATELVAQIRNG